MASTDGRDRLPLTRSRGVRALFVISVMIIVVGWAVRTVVDAGSVLSAVIVPIAVSLLVTALLMPLQVLLNHRLRLPRAVAAGLSLIVAIAAIVGLLWVSGAQLAGGVTSIVDTVREQIEAAREWLTSESPIGTDQINEVVAQAQTWIEANQASLAQGVLGAGVNAAGTFVSVILALVATFFFLAQGDRIFAGLVVLLPRDHHRSLYEASRRGWVTLSTYCRTQLVVAGVDAVGIGLGALALGVPFVVPIMAITFVLCFIPFVGAIVSGAVAVAMALAFQGVGIALLMLLVCVLVQQLESNVLSPLLMGRAVDVHPLLILFSVAAATYIFGIVGALFAVPVIATIKSMALYLSGSDPFPGLATGGRALTTPPKVLIGEKEELPSPRRIGDASPRWLVREQEAADRAAERAAAADAANGSGPGQGATRTGADTV